MAYSTENSSGTLTTQTNDFSLSWESTHFNIVGTVTSAQECLRHQTFDVMATCLLVISILFGAGNLLTILAFSKDKVIWSKTFNIMPVALSASDLALCWIVAPIQIVSTQCLSLVNNKSVMTCFLSRHIGIASMITSLCLTFAMGGCRYWTITRTHLNRQLSRRWVWIAIAICYCLGTLTSIASWFLPGLPMLPCSEREGYEPRKRMLVQIPIRFLVCLVMCGMYLAMHIHTRCVNRADKREMSAASPDVSGTSSLSHEDVATPPKSRAATRHKSPNASSATSSSSQVISGKPRTSAVRKTYGNASGIKQAKTMTAKVGFLVAVFFSASYILPHIPVAIGYTHPTSNLNFLNLVSSIRMLQAIVNPFVYYSLMKQYRRAYSALLRIPWT